MMTQKTRRIGGLIAATALTVTLAACSGGQSVEEACKVIQDKAMPSVQKAETDAQEAVQRSLNGEDVDYNEIFASADASIKDAQKEISNDEVKEKFDAFADEYENYVKVFNEFKVPDTSSLDQTDPDAVNEANEQLQELSQTMMDEAEKIQAAGKDIDEVCGA